MSEYSVPAKFSIADDENCTNIIFNLAQRSPQHVVFRQKQGDEWAPITAADAAARISSIAKGLIASGINPGDRVALLSRTRLEWNLFDFAIWSAGAIPVPIYDSSSASQIEWILRDSGAVAIVL